MTTTLSNIKFHCKSLWTGCSHKNCALKKYTNYFLSLASHFTVIWTFYTTHLPHKQFDRPLMKLKAHSGTLLAKTLGKTLFYLHLQISLYWERLLLTDLKLMKDIQL